MSDRFLTYPSQIQTAMPVEEHNRHTMYQLSVYCQSKEKVVKKIVDFSFIVKISIKICSIEIVDLVSMINFYFLKNIF